ncbi:MAG: DMT family transporter [Propionibacteriaceae bacterium]|jgi:DME family drug/metabolite transporter|nr:DMT family transporter [Propionibacteriaceae bacterium]
MRYVLFVIGAGILYGTTGTSQAFAPESASSLSIGSARLGVGGLLLGIVGLAYWLRKPIAARTARGGWPTLAAIAIGAASVMGYQATFFAGTRANGVAVGTVLAIGSSPMFAGFFEWLILRVKPDLRWLLLTLLGVFGVYLLSATGNALAAPDIWGVVASLTAGASYAAYTVAMRVLLNRGWGSLEAVSSILALGAVMALANLATTDISWISEPGGVPVVAWLAIATVMGAYTLNAAGLAGISAAKTATLTLAEPATATALGVLVLREQLSVPGALGIAIVVVSVVLLGMPSRAKT